MHTETHTHWELVSLGGRVVTIHETEEMARAQRDIIVAKGTYVHLVCVETTRTVHV